MKVFILSAGIGSRLGALTKSRPKALVDVNGETMLEHNIKCLQSYGFNDFVINVHHFSDQIVSFLEQHRNFGSDIKISQEIEEPLETGGAVKKAAKLLGDSNFIVHNVDIYSNLDYRYFATESERIFNESNSIATLLISNRKTERYLVFDSENNLVGWTNIKTKEVKSPYQNIDISKCSLYAFSGIHSLSPKVYGLMDSWPDKFSIIDFYLSICKDYKITPVIYPNLKLYDLGTEEKIEKYISDYKL